MRHGRAVLDLGEFLVSGAFLSAMFENWQSEFLSTAVLVVLGIMLRERLSRESKAVGPNEKTGV